MRKIHIRLRKLIKWNPESAWRSLPLLIVMTRPTMYWWDQIAITAYGHGSNGVKVTSGTSSYTDVCHAGRLRGAIPRTAWQPTIPGTKHDLFNTI